MQRHASGSGAYCAQQNADPNPQSHSALPHPRSGHAFRLPMARAMGDRRRWTTIRVAAQRKEPREGLIAQQRNAATITDRAGPERATCKIRPVPGAALGIDGDLSAGIPGRNSELAGSLGSSAGAIIGIIAAGAIPSASSARPTNITWPRYNGPMTASLAGACALSPYFLLILNPSPPPFSEISSNPLAPEHVRIASSLLRSET